MKTTSGLDFKLHEMAQRIRDLREIVGLSPEDMARLTGVDLEEYLQCEAGESDLNFAFIYRCAQAFGVDVTDIIEGSSPRLSNYTLTRAGEGQHIEHAHGMTYYNMAARFKKRVAEPLYVVAEYSEEAQLRPIECTTHEGQECDIVLSGQLKVQVGEHIEILNPGDTIYYNSTASHGMIATGGRTACSTPLSWRGPGTRPRLRSGRRSWSAGWMPPDRRAGSGRSSSRWRRGRTGP